MWELRSHWKALVGWVEQGVRVGIGTGWAGLLRAPQAIALSHVSGSGFEARFFSRISGTGGQLGLSPPQLSNIHQHGEGLAVHLAKPSVFQK